MIYYWQIPVFSKFHAVGTSANDPGKEGHGGRGTPAPGVFGQSCERLPLAEPRSGHAVGSEHLLPTKYSPAPDRPGGHGPLALKGRRALLPAKWLLILLQAVGTLTQSSLTPPVS